MARSQRLRARQRVRASQRLQASEYIPDERDLELASRGIVSSEKSSRRIDNKISALLAQRARVAKEWNHMKGFYSLIRRMPPDLLGMIFVFCLGHSTPSKKNFTKTSILGVCRRWRNIALDTPAFWTSLDIRTSLMFEDFDANADIEDSHSEPYFPMHFLTWTARNSGSLSLDITLTFPLHPTLSSGVLSVLQSNLHRCRSLTISGPKSTDFLNALFSHPPCSPVLETLDIEVDSAYDDDGTASLLHTLDLTEARRLRALRCPNVVKGLESSFSVQSLEHLFIGDWFSPVTFHVPTAISLLKLGKDIVTCILTVAKLDMKSSTALLENRFAAQSVPLHSLKHLVLVSGCSESLVSAEPVAQLLRLLEVPALQNLEFTTPSTFPDEIGQLHCYVDLQGLLEECNHWRKVVSNLSGLALTRFDLIRLLKLGCISIFSNIRKLHLSGCSGVSELLRYLAKASESRCPKLVEVHLRGPHFEAQPLKYFLECRKKPGKTEWGSWSGIKKIEIQVIKRPDPDPDANDNACKLRQIAESNPLLSINAKGEYHSLGTMGLEAEFGLMTSRSRSVVNLTPYLFYFEL